MAVKVIRKSTGEVGYGDEYPRSTIGEPLRWSVKFPKNDEEVIFADGDSDFEVDYLDDSAVVDELIKLNERCTK